MVIWEPEKQHELRKVYDLCRRMGAPHFLSPDDMSLWLSRNWLVVRRFIRNKYHYFLEPYVVGSVVGSLVKLLQEVFSHGNILAEELKWLVFKALHTPLLSNRKSLHPIDSVA